MVSYEVYYIPYIARLGPSSKGAHFYTNLLNFFVILFKVMYEQMVLIFMKNLSEPKVVTSRLTLSETTFTLKLENVLV